MKTKRFSDLYDVFRLYSKHGGDDADAVIQQACDYLVELFRTCMNEPDPLDAFVLQLKEDGRYSSWTPK